MEKKICYHENQFSGRFEDARWTFLQNSKDKQQITFKYFTQHIW